MQILDEARKETFIIFFVLRQRRMTIKYHTWNEERIKCLTITTGGIDLETAPGPVDILQYTEHILQSVVELIG